MGVTRRMIQRLPLKHFKQGSMLTGLNANDYSHEWGLFPSMVSIAVGVVVSTYYFWRLSFKNPEHEWASHSRPQKYESKPQAVQAQIRQQVVPPQAKRGHRGYPPLTNFFFRQGAYRDKPNT